MENYTIKHIGEGRFKAIMEDSIKDVGPSLGGMIRYTYFEDFSIPPIGWEVTHDKLMEDYQPKVMKDISDGKITNTSTTDNIK